MMRILVGAAAAAALLALAAPAAAQPADDARLVWDLTRLFPDDAAWDAEHAALAAEVARLRSLQGTLGRDAAALLAVLDGASAASQRLRKLAVFANTQLSTANGDARHQERAGKLQALVGQAAAAAAWIDPELQSLGAAKLAAFTAAEPRLQRHGVRLRRALQSAPHTLSADAEGALAAMAPVLGAFSSTRELLVNVDIAWPTIEVDGRPERVGSTGYVALRAHRDRTVRKQAFDAFWKTYGQFENSFGALLAQRVQRGVIEARLRRHDSAAAAALADDEVPEAVLRTLVAEVNRALPTLHRYFRLRQKMLGLPDLHYYDVYPDLVEAPRRYPPDEAAALTLAALRPLGGDFESRLRLALSARTMHVRPAPGKRGGAYAASATATRRTSSSTTPTTSRAWSRSRTNGATACTRCWRSARSRTRARATRCSWPRSRR